jgi:hypothetical protein
MFEKSTERETVILSVSLFFSEPPLAGNQIPQLPEICGNSIGAEILMSAKQPKI